MVIANKHKTHSVSGEWECDECGYVRAGTLRSRPKRCPLCNASGDAFTFWSDEEDDWDDVDDVEAYDFEWDDDDF